MPVDVAGRIRVQSPDASISQPGTRSKIRVLHVLPTLAMGGAERMVLDLFRTLHDNSEFEMKLCVLGASQHAFYRGFDTYSQPTFLDYSLRYRDFPSTIRTIRRIRQQIHEFQPHVLHTHLWIADFVGAAAVLRTGTQHVSHIHNTWAWYAGKTPGLRFRRKLFSTLLLLSNPILIGCSDAAKRYTCTHLKRPIERAVTIPYGIDVGAYAAIEPARAPSGRPLIVGAAGRFVPEKGHLHLIDAIAILRDRGANVRLRLAGNGPLLGEYRRQIAEQRLDDWVDLPGRVTDMPGFYSGIDVFVQPSLDAEGLPLAILEAMASSRPVIATNVAGAPEAVRHELDGIIAPRTDAASLADAIQGLLDDSSKLYRMGMQARDRARESFSTTRMVSEIVTLYRQVAEVAA